MNNINTPFVYHHATHEVLKSLHTAHDSNNISLACATEVLEQIAYKKEGYYRHEPSDENVLKYVSSASNEQLVGQWARCALYSCIDPSAFQHADIQTVLDGFPPQKSMGNSQVHLQYLDHTVFQGSAWDLMMDMLLVPQSPDQTYRLSRHVIKWATNMRIHGIVEMPQASSSEKWQHVWKCISSRTKQIEHVFGNSERSCNEKADFRTALCDIMPYLFTSEELALEMAASAAWQTWVKYVALTNTSDLNKIASAIIGSPLDISTKKQLGSHLKSLVETEALKNMLENIPSQTIIQGLWKSYFAFAEGCGFTTQKAVDLQKNNFKAGLTNNVSSTLVMGRYLPLFKAIPDFESVFLEMPVALWEKHKLGKSVSADKCWIVLQKHNIVPSTVHWNMVEEELKNFKSYTDKNVAHEKLKSLLQNYRLRQEIMDTVQPQIQPAPNRRRM